MSDLPGEIRKLLSSEVLHEWAVDRARLRRTAQALRADNIRTRKALKKLMIWLHENYADADKLFKLTGVDAVSKLFIIWEDETEREVLYLTHQKDAQLDWLDPHTRFPLCAGEAAALESPPPIHRRAERVPRRPVNWGPYSAARRLAKQSGPYNPFAAEAALEATVNVDEASLYEQPSQAESIGIAALTSMRMAPPVILGSAVWNSKPRVAEPGCSSWSEA